jgi:hypothetical protein
MAELSSLSRLQELRLAHGGDWLECAGDWTDGEAAVRLAAVRRSMACLQCLTSLHLQWLYPPPLPECLSQLPALEELSLHDCFCLQPNCLAGGDKLKSLTISRSVEIHNSPLLLQHLGRMTQLTSLNLHRSCAVYSIDAPPSVFAALTASSSSLQRLDLSSCLLDDGWPIVFRQAGRRRLTAVTNLKLQGAEPELSVSDIRKLSLACPNLHTLDLRDALQPKASLLALTNLAGLTALEISRVTTESAVRFLAQLTTLRELRVFPPSEVSRVSRLHLTALKQLQELLLPACDGDEACELHGDGTDDSDGDAEEVDGAAAVNCKVVVFRSKVRSCFSLLCLFCFWLCLIFTHQRSPTKEPKNDETEGCRMVCMPQPHHSACHECRWQYPTDY